MPTPRVLVNALSLSEGGGRSYVTNLARELDRDSRGFAFTLLGLAGAFDGIDTGSLPVATVRLPSAPRAVRMPSRVLFEQLLLPLRARRFDLLYCIADIAPRWGATPTVVLSRNLNIYDRRWYDDGRTRMLARLAAAGMRHAQRIVFPSQAAADQIGEWVPIPKERIRIVHYGVSLTAFEDTEPGTSEIPYLFLPAAVERHKNFEVLIRALPLLRDERTEIWVAGHSLTDPSHRSDLERLARDLGVSKRLRFLGPVPYREVLRYYRGALALVFPSFIETFGHPLVEAMAAGTPVIASEIAAFREIAGNAALYFPVDQPQSLADAVERTRTDPAATQARVAAGLTRAQQFDWTRSVDALCAVFEETLRTP